MKLNITITPEELNGYKNISPLKGDNILELQVENNSCVEIVALILDFIPHTILANVLHNYSTKLRHSGKLILSGTSASLLIKQFINGTLDLKGFNTSIYGENKHAWDIKRSLLDIDDVKKILLQCGLKIETQILSDNKFIITGIRE